MIALTEIPVRADPTIRQAVERRWNSLTKPPESLGRIESLIVDLAEMQGTARPSLDGRAIYVFCGDHGVTAEGVSAWPSEVTSQMVRNFVRGGAAISVLCRSLSIDPVIVDCGVQDGINEGAVDCRIAAGTRNFAHKPAMTRAQAEQAIENGIALARGCTASVVGIGEMGIGNTSSASALVCAFTGWTPEETVGIGAGSSAEGISRKREALRKGLALHRETFADPIDALAALGGFEIATMTGFILECAALRRPIFVDGFITTSAVLAVRGLAPNVTDYLFYSHCSAEQAHKRVLDHLSARPILDLEMRLGEGTGAALAMGVVKQALMLYEQMATFEQASVAS